MPRSRGAPPARKRLLVAPRPAMLSTLLLLQLLGLVASATAENISVTPTTVATEIPTVLTVVGSGFVANGSALCSITSLDNTFVGINYGPVGDYNCTKRVMATVINTTHLTCKTVRLHNSAPAIVKVSLDNGTNWLPGQPLIQITPLVEVAVGRRPYTSETEGQLVVKVAGPPLLALGVHVAVTAKLPAAVHAAPVISEGSAPSGSVGLVPFALASLPATVFADLTITVTIPGHGAITYSRNFQRAPPPNNPNITVVVVDHATRGMLLGRGKTEDPWLPFLAVGWFNSAFTYAMETTGDPTFAPAAVDVSPLLVAGADRSKEWGRKGINLVRMGWRNPPEMMIAELDHMYAAGVYAMISVPTAGHCNETAKPGTPARNCSADYANMLGNMTLVKGHPATWGYYICDDCCAGYDYLKELAVVYQQMKAIDPYHLTAGALECGEMHAFQEPQLSLDAPMRENYRPDLTFHANDGVVRGGSDGVLRMPPMTFEPIINMADAVRQPRGFLAQTAAWLGVITADMPMQNWYVYNHIMYARWLLEDATSALNAQMLELAPSLLGHVTTSQPRVTVVEGNDWIRAKAWRDAAYEAQQQHAVRNLCVHVAVASVGQKPGTFALQLAGICGGGTLPPCPGKNIGGLNATHLFNQFYSVAIVDGVLRDVLTPGATSIYAIGCDTSSKPDVSEPINLCMDPGFEDSEMPLTPGFLTCEEESTYRKGTFKGQCKVEDKHAGSWGLPQAQSGGYDARASFFVDSTMPRRGRHAGRLWVPSASPIAIGVPGATTNLGGIKIMNESEYRVEVWARSFPAGMAVEITVGSWVEEPLIPRTPLGLTAVDVYKPLSPRNEPVRLTGNWTKLLATVPKGVRPATASLNLLAMAADGAVAPGGSIWFDDAKVVCSQGCPPPGN